MADIDSIKNKQLEIVKNRIQLCLHEIEEWFTTDMRFTFFARSTIDPERSMVVTNDQGIDDICGALYALLSKENDHG